MLLYLILLRVGFTLPHLLPVARCALTAPFHPYRVRFEPGGIFSAALSVGSRLPGITWHPALWSPDFPPSRLRETATVRPTLAAIIQTKPKNWAGRTRKVAKAQPTHSAIRTAASLSPARFERTPASEHPRRRNLRAWFFALQAKRSESSACHSNPFGSAQGTRGVFPERLSAARARKPESVP